MTERIPVTDSHGTLIPKHEFNVLKDINIITLLLSAAFMLYSICSVMFRNPISYTIEDIFGFAVVVIILVVIPFYVGRYAAGNLAPRLRFGKFATNAAFLYGTTLSIWGIIPLYLFTLAYEKWGNGK